ncbi:MAG TPA: nitrile hydratase subunit beta [Candidatus Dormibacteraeota bacterium]|nr:nitrile hydratase subunit beta [Candidatus Dormibacteraeota bacterium]
MNGIHDMGGMHGFGPVPVERDEPVFHASWERSVVAVQRATRPGLIHLDEFRAAIERIPAARYLEASYYERWLMALETLLVEKGAVTPEELRTGRAAGPAPPRRPRPPDDRPPLRPRFRAGQAVVARNRHPAGHTRMPRYVRGRRGVVRSAHGPFLLPDTNAAGVSRDWEAVYAVEFPARELWGAEAPAADVVCVDLWESYLDTGEGA